MATSNTIRALNRLPFDFQDGLKVGGVDVTNLNQLNTPAGASLIGFTPVGGISATSVQAALAELDSEKLNAISVTAAGGAGVVGFTPVGGLSAGNVQAALAELDLEKMNVAALAAASGSGAIGYKQKNAGSVTTTVDGKLNQTVSAKDFGALGDGLGTLASADFIANANTYYVTSGALYLQEPRFKVGFDTQDFVALQLAIDVASATGKELLIPAGDYIITKCLIVKRSGLTIRGEGMFTTLIRQSASAGWLAEASDDSQMLVGGKVYASYNYNTGRNWSTTGVFQADNFHMEGVGIIGDKTGFASGGWYYAGAGSQLPYLVLTELLQSGVQPQGELTRFSKNVTIKGCYFTGHAECGIEPTYVDGLKIEGCYATQNGWQFIGTDHAIRNVQIINNIGMEPAVGNSESAFLDLEDGKEADYENVTVSGNLHIATVSGFVKIHPRKNAVAATGVSVRNIVISDNISISGGAVGLGFYGQYGDTSKVAGYVYGDVSNVTITGNIIKGYKTNIIRIGSSDAGSGKALNTVVANNYIESVSNASTNTVAIDIPKSVEGCVVANNVVRLVGNQQYFSRISWSSPTDETTKCKQIRFSGNDVELKSASYMIDFAQIDGLFIDGNRFDASGTTMYLGGGFLGQQGGANKANVYVRNNKITLYQRQFIICASQRITNLVIENNHIIATTPDSATRYLFGLNQQVTQAIIKNNRIEAGIAPVLMVGDGVTIGNTASATATVSGGSVNAVTVTAIGRNYNAGYVQLVFSGGGGVGAKATATVSESGPVTSISVSAQGSGYTSPPTVSITGGGGGSGATATAVLTGDKVTSITVTNGGSGYTSNPTVSITGGGGSGATATATAAYGHISAITVTNGGSGYTSAPAVLVANAVNKCDNVVFSGNNVTHSCAGNAFEVRQCVGFDFKDNIINGYNGGSGAAATAVVADGKVSSISVSNPGTGYFGIPTISFSGGGGSGAVAIATVSNAGVLTEIKVLNGGSGYTSSPTVVITPPGGSGLVVPVYTTTSSWLLEGAVTVANNKFVGLGAGSLRIGIRLSYRMGDAQDSALVTGNVLQAAAGSYLSYPIVVEGNPRTVGIFSNILHGVEDSVPASQIYRYGIYVDGSTSTAKIQASVVGNLIHGKANTLAVYTGPVDPDPTTVNATLSGNHLSTTY